MPSGAEPVRVPWIASTKIIEGRHRLRISVKELKPVISWLPTPEANSIACVTNVGTSGQLQIVPKDADSDFVKTLSSDLVTSPPLVTEVNNPWLAFARYTATRWPVSCTLESTGDRVTFQLPKECRDLDLVPGERESAVIFVTGAILELWKPKKWIEFASQYSANSSILTELAIDSFSGRSTANTRER
jgi:hypothetical protein